MSQVFSEILSHIDGLTPQERAELAYAFVCSLEPDEEQGIAEAWDAELSRRVAEIRSGKAIGSINDDVLTIGQIGVRNDWRP